MYIHRNYFISLTLKYQFVNKLNFFVVVILISSAQYGYNSAVFDDLQKYKIRALCTQFSYV